jgi:hypothetical protein
MSPQVSPSLVSPWCPILAGEELLWRPAIRAFTQARGGLEFSGVCSRQRCLTLDGDKLGVSWNLPGSTTEGAGQDRLRTPTNEAT